MEANRIDLIRRPAISVLDFVSICSLGCRSGRASWDLLLELRELHRKVLGFCAQLHHLHLFLGPWLLSSSRSSAVTSSSHPIAGGSHRRTSRHPSPCVASMLSTAEPSTPASALASCHPRLHPPRAPTPPRSRRRPSRSHTTGRSGAGQYL